MIPQLIWFLNDEHFNGSNIIVIFINHRKVLFPDKEIIMTGNYRLSSDTRVVIKFDFFPHQKIYFSDSTLIIILFIVKQKCCVVF